MPCPTCDHTLATLCISGGITYRHCERCGTIVLTPPAHVGPPPAFVPKLVQRCRLFSIHLRAAPEPLPLVWHQLGIAEAIDTPFDRPDPPKAA